MDKTKNEDRRVAREWNLFCETGQGNSNHRGYKISTFNKWTKNKEHGHLEWPYKGEMCLQDLGTHSYAQLLCDVKQQHIEKTKTKVERAKKKAKMIASVKPPETVDHSLVQTGQSTDQPAMFIKI